jgi:hypothetical protein
MAKLMMSAAKDMRPGDSLALSNVRSTKIVGVDLYQDRVYALDMDGGTYIFMAQELVILYREESQ